jgi:hypothetical protein
MAISSREHSVRYRGSNIHFVVVFDLIGSFGRKTDGPSVAKLVDLETHFRLVN